MADRTNNLSTAKKILFSIIPLIVLLFASETLLYFAGYKNPVGTSMRFGGAYKDIMEQNPYTGIKFKPYEQDFFEESARLNSLGLRDDELYTDADVKILCLGDSTTFGYLVKRNQTYSSILEKRLNNGKQTFEILNAGVPSYTVYQGYQLYSHYLKDLTHWDYVIITFGWNDIALGKGGEIDTQHGIELPEKKIIVLNQLLFLARKLRTFNFLENKLDHLVYEKMDKDELIIRHYELYYRELVKEATRMGSKVIILPVVSKNLQTENTVDPRMAFYNNITKRIALDENAVYLDIITAFHEKRDQVGWFELIHYDETGHRVIADELFDYITEDLQLNPHFLQPSNN